MKFMKLLKYLFIKPVLDTYYFFKNLSLFFIKKILGCVNYIKKRIKKYKKTKAEKKNGIMN